MDADLERGRYAVIIAGSGSDKPHVEKLTDNLKKYGIDAERYVCSAHKQPRKAIDLMDMLNKRGEHFPVISVAGKTDALSGILAYHLDNLVISCPPDGMDNRSVLGNPPGSSNVTAYDAKNAARAAAQYLSHLHPHVKKALAGERKNKSEELEQAGEDIK